MFGGRIGWDGGKGRSEGIGLKTIKCPPIPINCLHVWNTLGSLCTNVAGSLGKYNDAVLV